MTPPLDASLPGESDAGLSDAWQHGDERAFDGIVERYGSLIYARCARALSPTDAQDATQAVFWVLAKRRTQAAASPALLAWLLRVAENVVRNAIRDRGRRSRAEHDAGQQIASITTTAPNEYLDRAELRQHLDAALELLPPREREAVELHYLAGQSLSEVAQLTASGVSTIKERIQRGVERLRRHLERRGLGGPTMTSGAVVLALERITTPMPSSLLPSLHALRLHPTSSIPRHIRRWAYQGISMSTILGTLGAAALLAYGVVTCSMHAAEVAPLTHPAGVPASASAVTSDALFDSIDPERANSWAVLRWHDGARTARRLSHLPELELLLDHGQQVLEQIASIHDGAFAISTDSMMMPEERLEHYRHLKNLSHLTADEHAQYIMHTMDEQQERLHHQKDALWSVRLPAIFGTLHATAPDAPVLRWLTSRLSAPVVRGCSVTKTDQGWILERQGKRIQILLTGAQLALHALNPDGTYQVEKPMTSFPGAIADSDMDCSFALDTGTGTMIPTWSTACTVTPDGLHLLSITQVHHAQRAAGRAPRVDTARFDQVPADAVIAGAVAVDGDSIKHSDAWQSAFTTLRAMMTREAPSGSGPYLRIINAVESSLGTIDGHLIAYIQPGALLPSVTLCADMPQTAYMSLLHDLGLTCDETGTTSVPLSVITLTVGWQQGHALVTTNPGGLASVTGQSGFARQPEIVKALAALPPGAPQVMVLLRPEALVSTCSAYMGMLSPAIAQRLPAYQQSLHAQTSFAYLTMTPGANTSRLEASGLLAAIAAAYVGLQMQMPRSNN